MRVTVRATLVGTVADLDLRNDLTLATDSQDVEAIKEYFGNRPAVEEFDGFLVKIEDGEYTEVYGFPGNIAWLRKPVYKITRTFSESKPRESSSSVGSKRKKSGSWSCGGSTCLGGMR
jgi:hypothetical protein